MLHSSKLDISLGEISNDFQQQSISDIQKLLVQKGIVFQNDTKDDDDESLSKMQQENKALRSKLEKVPGCVANVQIQTILLPAKSNSKNDWQIHLHGTSDALLSRGMLAILTTALSSAENLEDILNLDAYSIADRLGIRRALSPGRNDGLASMVQVIQNQIRRITNNENAADILYIDETTKDNQLHKTDDILQKEEPKERTSFDLKQEDGNENGIRPKVALLLSGGVDSSVALRLLLQQNYDVTAFYLRIWLEDELAHLGQCPWEDDYNVCRQVCEQAQVPLETLSLQEEYKDRVISYTINEAQRGRTPNPDILCNSRIKFGCFYDAIAERDFDYVATGHYARLETVDMEGAAVEKKLFRAPDPVKDQSYFLCALTQDQLKRVIFPLGHMEKSRVRELAEEFQLPNRHRPDSQGLCFLGKVKFEEFLEAYLGERPGNIVDAATGDLLGRHRGVWYHTVGQRKGIGKVLDPLATSRGPWYVVAKDPDRDLVFCSNQYDEDIFTAARSEVHVEDIQWIAGAPPSQMTENSGVGRFEMKIRHGPKLVSGSLTLADSSGESGLVQLVKKDGGLAPGQFVVFYRDEECLGGGVISERHWAKFLSGSTCHRLILSKRTPLR